MGNGGWLCPGPKSHSPEQGVVTKTEKKKTTKSKGKCEMTYRLGQTKEKVR
jgi:hypothetical protein